MSVAFDIDDVARRGWRQGAVMDPAAASLARQHARAVIDVHCGDLLIVASHDCDVLNPSIEKEPFVEVLAARQVGEVGPMQMLGRNPRTLEFTVVDGDHLIALSCSAHRRWSIPRELLLEGEPRLALPNRERRLVAEWLAKRYIRAAFPSAFDERWRGSLRAWQKLLQRWSEWVQGVYLRLSTLTELGDDDPYHCDVLVAVPQGAAANEDWPRKRLVLEGDVEGFWSQFKPGIDCSGVEILSTDEITLADIERYQRFDADWISYGDETASPPMVADVA